MATDPLEFGGEEQFAADARRVFDVVTDLDVLARVMPDVESSRRIDADTLSCVVRPGFSFLRGKLNVTIHRLLSDDTRPTDNAAADAALATRFRVESKAIGVQIVVETSLHVEPASGTTDENAGEAVGASTTAPDARSTLKWQAAVIERKGLVAAVSPTLLRAAAEKVIQETWLRLRAELEKGSRS